MAIVLVTPFSVIAAVKLSGSSADGLAWSVAQPSRQAGMTAHRICHRLDVELSAVLHFVMRYPLQHISDVIDVPKLLDTGARSVVDPEMRRY
jgi:hypothetical protein